MNEAGEGGSFGGGAQMDDEAVEDFAQRLGNSGSQLAAHWESEKSAIGLHEGGIGQGRLGAAFRAHYIGPSGDLKAKASRIPPAYEGAAESARASAQDYRAHDARAAAEFTGNG